MQQLRKVEYDRSTPSVEPDYTPLRVTERPKSILVGSLWMVGITLALFFLPLLNGLVGGLVGGYYVGTVKRALTAAILPAVIAAAGLWILLSLFSLPMVGFLAGVTLGILILLSDLGIFLGAILGAIISNKGKQL